MKTYTSAAHRSAHPCVLALGCFDGVHLGHAHLISTARKIADEQGLDCTVWSFATPPRGYFSGTDVPMLTTPAEKRAQMRALGVDTFISVPIKKEIFELEPEAFFADILQKRLNARHIVCGFNYRFGKGGRGDATLLSTLCAQGGIGISVIPEYTVDGMSVSSSAIRSLLESGEPQQAAKLLGRPYSLSAQVIGGKQLGRTLGFPTVNQALDANKAAPRYGVYLSRVTFWGKTRYGITNVGVRPTVGGSLPCCETNIFDFSGDIYGKRIKLEFLHFIRPERQFDSIDALQTQVLSDIAAAKELLISKETGLLHSDAEDVIWHSSGCQIAPKKHTLN